MMMMHARARAFIYRAPGNELALTGREVSCSWNPRPFMGITVPLWAGIVQAALRLLPSSISGVVSNPQPFLFKVAAPCSAPTPARTLATTTPSRCAT